nr:glyoxalase superfamily protein [Azospirillum sp. 412522]
MRDYRDAKVMAQTLRDSLAIKDLVISHSESLELVSRMLGLPDWNTLSAKLQGERNGAAPNRNRTGSSEISTDERDRKLVEQVTPRTAIDLEPHLFDKFVGYYQSQSGDLLNKVYREEGRFFCQITAQRPVEFYPESKSKFFTPIFRAQVSFITDSHDRVTGLILHQNGFESLWNLIDDKSAELLIKSLEGRIKNNLPHADTEKALRRFIEGIISGNPNYDEMAPEQAQAIHDQLSYLKSLIEKEGVIKFISFIGIQDNGDDIYHVHHEKRLFRWTIGLDPDGKVKRSWVTSGG